MVDPCPHLTRPRYRPDIDGLRAIAVLLVVAFHAFPRAMKGGFIGVDVFFVISGFLISSIIFENLASNRFSFIEFYVRRIKRIFPSLLVVLLACYTLGWFILMADEYRLLGEHTAAGAGFVSNLILWKESGYFDSTSETKPLLHLWSLGIEEQFYIVWPLLLAMAWRCRANLLWVAVVLAGLSFGWNLTTVRYDSLGAFYSPLTRFWELLAGGSLAWMVLNRQSLIVAFRSVRVFRSLGAASQAASGRRADLACNLIGLIGAFCLVLGLGLVNRDRRFPGWWAIFPVLAAVLTIAAGANVWLNKVVLSNRVLVWIGRISYPLYLWHWPLLSYMWVIRSGEPSQVERMAVIGVSLVLAWITYRLIERPIRWGTPSRAKPLLLILFMAAVGYLGFNTYLRDGLSFRNRDRQAFLDYFENSRPEWHFAVRQHIYEAYRFDCNFYDIESGRQGFVTEIPLPSIEKSCYTRDKTKPHSVFIWGDSHAQQLYYGVHQNLPADWQVLQVASSSCKASFDLSSDPRTNYCSKSNGTAIDAISVDRPDVVLIGQNGGIDAHKAAELQSRLLSLGVSKVLFVGPVPHWKTELPKIIARQLWVMTPERTFVGLNTQVLAENERLKREFSAAGLHYVDAISSFCNEHGCLTRIGNDRLTGITTQDYGHLLQTSSDFLARSALVREIVAK